MKFTTTLLTAIFAATALASPKERRSGLADRIARREAGLQPHKDSLMIPSTGTHASSLALANSTKTSYSTNWAGAALTSPPSSSETFTAAYGTFTVPKPSSRGAAAAWVGIDGYNTNTIIQSGIDFNYNILGGVSFDAWYEWYPEVSYDFSNFDISVGDVITISIETTSDAAGTVTIDNETTGKSVSEALSAPRARADLEGLNAEWIVEDFESGGSLVAFADFGTVTFTDCYAVTSSGTEVGLDDAELIDIEQSNTVLTKSTLLSDSSVQITYV